MQTICKVGRDDKQDSRRKKGRKNKRRKAGKWRTKRTTASMSATMFPDLGCTGTQVRADGGPSGVMSVSLNAAIGRPSGMSAWDVACMDIWEAMMEFSESLVGGTALLAIFLRVGRF